MASASQWLVVGLGNPGARYQRNRHNLGFLAVDHWVQQQAPGAGWRSKWNAQTTTVRGPLGQCIVLKPQTYMNRSGKSVQAAARFLRIAPEQLMVVHDELDFPFGRVAIKRGGGHGGHNGLRDLVEQLGTRDFVRIRGGVGRPARGDVTGWLLSDFSAEEQAELPDLLDLASAAISMVLEQGVSAAMNSFNRPVRD